MARHALNRIHGLSVRWAVLEVHGRRVTVQEALQLAGVVRGAMVIDREGRVAVRSHSHELRAKESPHKATIITEHADKHRPRVVLHGALPQKVSGLVQEESGACVAVQVWAKTSSQIEAGAHPRRHLLTMRRAARACHPRALLCRPNVR